MARLPAVTTPPAAGARLVIVTVGLGVVGVGAASAWRVRRRVGRMRVVGDILVWCEWEVDAWERWLVVDLG